MQWHHLLPRAVFTPKVLKELGLDELLDIHDSKWGVMLEEGKHGKIHSKGWNAEWEDWLTTKKGKTVTLEELEKKAIDMQTKYKIKTAPRATTRWPRAPRISKATAGGLSIVAAWALTEVVAAAESIGLFADPSHPCGIFFRRLQAEVNGKAGSFGCDSFANGTVFRKCKCEVQEKLGEGFIGISGASFESAGAMMDMLGRFAEEACHKSRATPEST